MAVFWDIAPRSLVEVDQRLVRSYCLHHDRSSICRDCPDNGCSMPLWNVSQLLRDYTAQYLRRQPSSYWPPSEPEILRDKNISYKLYLCLNVTVNISRLKFPFFINRKNYQTFASYFQFLVTNFIHFRNILRKQYDEKHKCSASHRLSKANMSAWLMPEVSK
jgi:hypothetical protein